MGRSLSISPGCDARLASASLSDQVRGLQPGVDPLLGEAAIQPDPALAVGDPTSKVSRVLRILKLRQARQNIFGERLFGEPAWDMFLQLYASTLCGKKECISSLCLASGVPSTTALRWIVHLDRDGWIEKHADPFDRRRTFVRPTQKGLEAMDRFFDHPYFVQVSNERSAPVRAAIVR